MSMLNDILRNAVRRVEYRYPRLNHLVEMVRGQRKGKAAADPFGADFEGVLPNLRRRFDEGSWSVQEDLEPEPRQRTAGPRSGVQAGHDTGGGRADAGRGDHRRRDPRRLAGRGAAP